MNSGQGSRPGRSIAVALLIWVLFAGAALAVFLTRAKPRHTAETPGWPALPSGVSGEALRVLLPESLLARALGDVKAVFESAEGLTVELAVAPQPEFPATAHDVLTAGQCDALVLESGDVAAYAKPGLLAPLDQPLGDPAVVPDSYRPGDIIPQITESCGRVDGQTYALPVTADVQILYYRRDLLSDIVNYQAFRRKYAYGLPCPPLQWDKAVDVARFFRDRDRPLYGMEIGCGPAGDAAYSFVMLLRSYGGQVLDSSGAVAFDSEAGSRALTVMRSLAAAGPPRAESLTPDEVVGGFRDGQASMCVGWWRYAEGVETLPDGSPSAVRDIVAYTVLPSGPAGEPSPVVRASCVAVSANARRLESAIRFAVWLTSPETSVRLSHEGVPPVRTSVLTDPDESKRHPQYEVLLRSLQVGKPMPECSNGDVLRRALSRAIARAAADRTPPPDAIRRAADAVRTAIQ